MADNTTKDRLKEITESIEQGIKELFQSDKYMDYLRTMSRFHKYSLNNTLLISMQKPDATHVAGFNKWRDQFSRNVKKGEKGIKIIAPTPYKVKKEMEKLDPVTQAPILNPDGKVITEEVEVKIPLYRVVSVFDVAQTEGKPLPELASNLTGDVKQYVLFMEALSRSVPVPISFEKMEADTDGYFSSQNQKIAIREGMSEVQTVSALIHEIAHSKLHDRTKQQAEAAQANENAEPPKPKDRRTEEVEAESISFAVCQYYGIQTGENSFGYIATWSKDKELPELRASLETIKKTASGLIEDIDQNFSEIIKERGIDHDELTEQATAISQESTPENTEVITEELSYPLPDPDMSLADRSTYGYLDDEMLPLSQERAAELFEQDLTVYLLYEDNTEAMAFDREDIDTHNGIFGIEKADWLALQDLAEMKRDGKLSPETREQLFRESTNDAYAIYQLKDGAELRDYRFEGLDWINSKGLTVEHDNYDFVYTDTFTKSATQRDRLEELWDRFNNDHPSDFKGHSLSVSDIVAIKQGGVVTYHYCDSFNFKELPKFAEPAPPVPDSFVTGEKITTPRGSFSLTAMTKEQMAAAGYGFHHSSDDGAFHIMGNGTRAFAIRNEDTPLRTAELSTEQNYNQIDGFLNNQTTVAELEKDAKSGKPISLMELLDATRREQKANLPQKKEKTAPPKGAEMEL